MAAPRLTGGQPSDQRPFPQVTAKCEDLTITIAVTCTDAASNVSPCEPGEIGRLQAGYVGSAVLLPSHYGFAERLAA